MKKHNSIALLSLFISLCSTSYSQNSTDLIPSDAISVVSINNVHLLQKVTLDELVRYDFMEEVQQELFDGSTSGKTLKESGIDFDQRISVFQGWNENFWVSGFTFGVKDQQALFDAFDDYERMNSDINGVTLYSSYFNRIAIEGNRAILFRVNPDIEAVYETTDSIWFSRGNDYPWFEMLHGPELNQYESFWETHGEDSHFENLNDSTDNELPLAEEDPNEKTYYELLDSVETALSEAWLNDFIERLFVEKMNLKKQSSLFTEHLAKKTEGTFYFDNTRNIDMQRSSRSMGFFNPVIYEKVQEVYEDNVILGDLVINENQVNLALEVRYSAELGAIYSDLTDAKFKSNILKYIHEDNNSYVVGNINLEEAYEQVFDLLIPMFSSENDEFSILALSWELLDEFVNKDAIFNTTPGSMFASYSGVQKVKTKKIEFEFNEDTFEYIEREVEAEENMPVFTAGLSTKRIDLVEKVIRRLGKQNSLIQHDGYWEFPKAIFESASLFVVLDNDIVVVTNDASMVRDHTNGYGSEAISSKTIKKELKNGVIYGKINTENMADQLPLGLFSEQENKIIDVMRGKPGTITLTSQEAGTESTAFNITYDFDGDNSEATSYLLDLINSLYVITK